MLTSILFSGLLPLLARAAPAPQGSPVPSPSPDPPNAPGVPTDLFELYAYGAGFGGLPVFYWNGLAYLGDYTLTNDTDAAEVVFASSTNDNTAMVGIPKPTSDQTTSWSNVTYYIPSDASTDRQTGFIATGGDITTDEVVDGFVFYGNTAAWAGDDGVLETKWYATPYESTDMWLLNWDQSTDTSSLKVQVTLRSAAPSIPPPNPPGPGNPSGSPAMRK